LEPVLELKNRFLGTGSYVKSLAHGTMDGRNRTALWSPYINHHPLYWRVRFPHWL